VSREEGGSSDLNRRLREAVVTDTRERADNGHSNVCLLRGLDLLDRVSLNHVTDLMPESSCQLVQLFRAFNKSAIDVDISAGQREGVHLFGVHDVKMPVQIRAAGVLCDRVAEVLDVSTDGRIGYDRQLRVDFLGVLPAQCDFLVLRDRAGRKDENESGRDEGTNHFVQGIGVNSGGQDMFHLSPLHCTEGQA
jgi:hypothetical protein